MTRRLRLWRSAVRRAWRFAESRQKMIFFMAIALLIVFQNGVVYLLAEPAPALLYRNTGARVAAKVTRELERLGVEYQIKVNDGGTDIFVPEQWHQELLFHLASKELKPADHSVGLDQETLLTVAFGRRLE